VAARGGWAGRPAGAFNSRPAAVRPHSRLPEPPRHPYPFSFNASPGFPVVAGWSVQLARPAAGRQDGRACVRAQTPPWRAMRSKVCYRLL